MADLISRALIAVAIMTLAAVAFLAGLGFLAAAAYSALADIIPPAAAAAAVGGGCLLIALLLLLIARASARPPRKSASGGAAPESGAGAGTSSFDSAARLGAEAGPLIRKNWKVATGGAFLIGLILGISPRARRALGDAMRDQL